MPVPRSFRADGPLRRLPVFGVPRPRNRSGEMLSNMASARDTYKRDGVVHLPRALNEDQLAAALAAFEWSLKHPGPLASKISQRTDALFYQDLANLDCLDAYRPMLEASPLPQLVSELWGTAECWFMYEQVFLKEGEIGRASCRERV